MKRIVISTLMMLLMAGSVYSKPSKPIADAIKTPISVFDMFLYDLENECAEKIIGNQDIADVWYYPEENLIFIYLFLSKRIGTLDNSLENNDKEKIEKHLRLLAKVYADQLGLQNDGSGIIQNISIRKRFQTKDIDEKKFKEEIIKRTVLKLSVKSKEKLYSLKRNRQGKYFLTIENLSNPTKKTK
jgi:hypothetical protein